LWCPPSTNPRAKLLPPKKASLFGVLELKTHKNEEVVGKKVGGWLGAAFIAPSLIEVGNVRKPHRLIIY
jgi:hypothetical protein